MKKIQRRCVTLIEMMIVMFLIALITGIVAVNYQGGLDEGKAFKTKMGIEKIESILNLEGAKRGLNSEELVGNWEGLVRSSSITKDPDALVKDGWGERYDVMVDHEKGGVKVVSKKLDEYERKKSSK